MTKVPQLPQSRNPAPRSRNSGAWIDLIAFLGVLCLGAVLIAFGHIAVGSLAAICAALGGLYAAYKRFRLAGRPAGRARAGTDLVMGM